jgi:hypothetical protein
MKQNEMMFDEFRDWLKNKQKDLPFFDLNINILSKETITYIEVNHFIYVPLKNDTAFLHFRRSMYGEKLLKVETLRKIGQNDLDYLAKYDEKRKKEEGTLSGILQNEVKKVNKLTYNELKKMLCKKKEERKNPYYLNNKDLEELQIHYEKVEINEKEAILFIPLKTKIVKIKCRRESADTYIFSYINDMIAVKKEDRSFLSAKKEKIKKERLLLECIFEQNRIRSLFAKMKNK